jgi:hypothetical protein
VNAATSVEDLGRLGGRGGLTADPSVPESDARLLADAFESVRDRHPDVLGAVAYSLGRGETIVRVLTTYGWAPALVRRTDMGDPDRVVRRVLAALGV